MLPFRAPFNGSEIYADPRRPIGRWMHERGEAETGLPAPPPPAPPRTPPRSHPSASRLMTVLGDFFNHEQFKLELMTVITKNFWTLL